MDNTFTEFYDMHKKNWKKATKKECEEMVDDLINMFKADDVDEQVIGRCLARIESYFAPTLTPKKDPIDWAVQALNPKDKREYCLYGVVLDDYGLCCTDSKRLHLLKGYQRKDKKVISPTKEWIEEEVLYPAAERIINEKPDAKVEVEIHDKKYIKVNNCYYPRTHYNQAISGMKNFVTYHKGENNTDPLYIEDTEKLALIMPMPPGAV